jgi:SPX domain protein involved in polyphosphate accumulation
VQYLGYSDLKAQLRLIEQFLEDGSKDKGSLEWLKLLFQRALDGEISKILDFYQSVTESIRSTIDDLQDREKVRRQGSRGTPPTLASAAGPRQSGDMSVLDRLEPWHFRSKIQISVASSCVTPL